MTPCSILPDVCFKGKSEIGDGDWKFLCGSIVI